MSLPASIASLITEISGAFPAAKVETQEFPSGGVWMDVFLGEHWFVFSSGPTSGIGVSDNSNEPAAFTNHDHYFDTIDEAGACLLSLLRQTANAPQTHAA